MRLTSCLAALAFVLAYASGAQAQSSFAKAKRGDTFELILTRDAAQRDNRGSSSSSHDQDILIEHVIDARADGLMLEYDLSRDATAKQREQQWQFPARVFKPVRGQIQILDRELLEARIDAWLTRGGMSRANCGKLVFTWNAFLIDCDPQSIREIVDAFELPSFTMREGSLYREPDTLGPGRLTLGSSGSTLVAEMAVDPDAIRRSRAQADVSVAELMRKSLTLNDALRARASDTVSGTITVTLDLSPGGQVWRRTKVEKLKISRPDGRVESETTTETLERRLIPPRKP